MHNSSLRASQRHSEFWSQLFAVDWTKRHKMGKRSHHKKIPCPPPQKWQAESCCCQGNQEPARISKHAVVVKLIFFLINEMHLTKTRFQLNCSVALKSVFWLLDRFICATCLIVCTTASAKNSMRPDWATCLSKDGGCFKFQTDLASDLMEEAFRLAKRIILSGYRLLTFCNTDGWLHWRVKSWGSMVRWVVDLLIGGHLGVVPIFKDDFLVVSVVPMAVWATGLTFI